MTGFDYMLNWKLKEGSHPFPGNDGGTCINEVAIVPERRLRDRLPRRRSAEAMAASTVLCQAPKIPRGHVAVCDLAQIGVHVVEVGTSCWWSPPFG